MNKIILIGIIMMLVMVQSVSASNKGEFIGDWEGGSPAIDITPIVILLISFMAASVIVVGIYAWLRYKSMQLEAEKEKKEVKT